MRGQSLPAGRATSESRTISSRSGTPILKAKARKDRGKALYIHETEEGPVVKKRRKPGPAKGGIRDKKPKSNERVDAELPDGPGPGASGGTDNDSAEATAYKEGLLALSLNQRSWKRERDILVDIILRFVDPYKEACRDFARRRAEKIEEVAIKFPDVAIALQQRFPILDSNRQILQKGDTVFSFRPFKEEQNAVVALAPAIAAPATHADEQVGQLDPTPVNVENWMPSASVTEQPARPVAGLDGEATPTPQPSKPLQAPPMTNSRALRPLPSPTPAAPSKAAFTTKQPPIKTSMVSRSKCWIFEYGSGPDCALYVMRCPSKSCGHPVFSKHPLRGDRATSHFAACGQPFKNERDIVRRYANLSIYVFHTHMTTFASCEAAC
jgi:hypothetical protein